MCGHLCGLHITATTAICTAEFKSVLGTVRVGISVGWEGERERDHHQRERYMIQTWTIEKECVTIKGK